MSDPARPVAIEDPLNRWAIHPLAAALLPPAVRLRLAPNAVSLAGLGLGAAAAFAYLHWRDPWLATLGFALMLGWHVMDGLDGKLARATGRTTAFGRVLDGAVDYLVFAIVLVPLSLTLPQPGWGLALCLFAAAFHVFQATWYEGERESWRRRAAGQFAATARPATGGRWTAGHNALERAFNRTRPIDAALADDPALLPRYLAATAGPLRTAALAGATARSAAIWLACLAGDPRLYWYWEILGISCVGVAVAATLRSREASL